MCSHRGRPEIPPEIAHYPHPDWGGRVGSQIRLMAPEVRPETTLTPDVRAHIAYLGKTPNPPLHRTLERLSRMKSLIESRPLRPHHRETILTKLEQHEAKLSDLASKYTVRCSVSWGNLGSNPSSPRLLSTGLDFAIYTFY